MTEQIQVIHMKKIEWMSIAHARYAGIILCSKYKFRVFDELLTKNIHMLLTELTPTQIKQIRKDVMVELVEDKPRIEF